MADERQQVQVREANAETAEHRADDAPRKKFNRVYFWGMMIALLIILTIFYVLAFSRQVHHGHGQADPQSTILVRPAMPAV